MVVVAVGAVDVVGGCHGGGFPALLVFQVAALQATRVEAAHGDAGLALALQLDQGLEGGLVEQLLSHGGGGEQVVEDPVGAEPALDLRGVSAALQLGLEGIEGLLNLVLGHEGPNLGVDIRLGHLDGLGVPDGLQQVAATDGALGVVQAVLAIGLPVHFLGIHALAGHVLREFLAVVVELQAHHGAGHLEGRGVQQGVQHVGVQPGHGVAFGGLLQILPHGGLEGLEVLEGAHVLGKLVTQDGHFLAADVLDLHLVGQGLAGEDGVGLIGGMGQGEGLLLVRLHPHQLGVEGALLVDLHHLILVALGLQALGLHADVTGGDEALGHGAVLHGEELGGPLAQALDVLVQGGLVDGPLLLGQGQGLVVGQGDFGGHVELGAEDRVGAFLQLQLLQGGVGDGQGARFLGGLPEVPLHQLLGDVGLDLAGVLLHEDRARGLAGTEAGDADLRSDLRHHLVEGGGHLCGGYRHFDGFPGGGLVMQGGGHGSSVMRGMWRSGRWCLGT